MVPRRALGMFSRAFSSSTEGRAMHIVTPLIRSAAMSKAVQGDVFLKMDMLQPSGSFKIRGIGRSVSEAVLDRGATAIVSSSGGNAGLAAAYAAQQLGVPATVVVPRTTKPAVRKILVTLGAEVVVEGSVWDEAHAYAERFVADHGSAFLVHPFEGATTWAGHSTVVDEVKSAWPHEDPPDYFVTVVGGGGLLIGILDGLERVGWGSVKVIACETHGAASLAKSLVAGHLVTLPSIDSIATSLGARRVSPTAFRKASERNVRAYGMADKDAVRGCLQLARDHRVLVEPACGAAVSWVMGGEAAPGSRVVVEVCGGTGAALPQMLQYCRDVDLDPEANP